MRFLFMLFASLLFLNVSADPPELNRKGKKVLEKFFDAENIELTEVTELTSKQDIFFVAKHQDSELGIVVLTTARGRYDHFDYMMIYNNNLQLELIKILVYRSQYGSEISGKRWLRQFYQQKDDQFKYGNDIQAISGATFSAMSLTKNVNRINKKVKEHFTE